MLLKSIIYSAASLLSTRQIEFLCCLPTLRCVYVIAADSIHLYTDNKIAQNQNIRTLLERFTWIIKYGLPRQVQFAF